MTSEADSVADEPLPEHLASLAAELRGSLPIDDVPDEVLAAARGAWTWRLIDSELAELAEQDLAVLRAGEPGVVTYAAGDVFIDVERQDGPRSGATVVTGQVTAPSEVEAIEAEVAVDPPRTVPIDVEDGGSFRITLDTTAPTRLVVRLSGGRRIVSGWLD